MSRLSENSVLSVKNKSFSVTGEVVVPDGEVNGTIIAQGGAIGGWSLSTRKGRALFTYNLLGVQAFTAEAAEPVPSGTHQVRAEFAYDGGGLGKGGDVSLYYDGKEVGSGRVGATQPFIFSADEGLDIGCEYGTPVAPDTTAESTFTGEINWVELTVGDDDHSDRIDPEKHLSVLMARQ
jgi:arylsulfatase